MRIVFVHSSTKRKHIEWDSIWHGGRAIYLRSNAFLVYNWNEAWIESFCGALFQFAPLGRVGYGGCETGRLRRFRRNHVFDCAHSGGSDEKRFVDDISCNGVCMKLFRQWWNEWRRFAHNAHIRIPCGMRYLFVLECCIVSMANVHLNRDMLSDFCC